MKINLENEIDFKYNYLKLCRKIDIISHIINTNKNNNLENEYENDLNLYIEKLNMILDEFNKKNKIKTYTFDINDSIMHAFARQRNLNSGCDPML